MKGLVIITISLVVIGQAMGIVANNMGKEAAAGLEAAVEQRIDTSAYE